MAVHRQITKRSRTRQTEAPWFWSVLCHDDKTYLEIEDGEASSRADAVALCVAAEGRLRAVVTARGHDPDAAPFRKRLALGLSNA